MVHGTPDWGFARSDVYILSEDLAELAARLGSIVTYDRRGNVMWSDDFSKGKGAWRSTTSGTGAAVELTTSYPKWPPFCVKLTGGSTVLREAQLQAYRAGWGVDAIGLEVSVAFLTSFDYFELGLWYYDGTGYHYAVVGLSDTDSVIYYRDTTGAPQTIATLNVRKHTNPNYNCLKLVVDFSTDKFVRLMLNKTSYDLSAYDVKTVASTTGPYLLVQLIFKSRSGENHQCLVDGIIITQGEA